jgi:hypothetical protein
MAPAGQATGSVALPGVWIASQDISDLGGRPDGRLMRLCYAVISTQSESVTCASCAMSLTG